jgi:hypothetical protein
MKFRLFCFMLVKSCLKNAFNIFLSFFFQAYNGANKPKNRMTRDYPQTSKAR